MKVCIKGIVFLMMINIISCTLDSEFTDNLMDKITIDETPYSGDFSLEISNAGLGQVVLTWENPVDLSYNHLEISYEPGGSTIVEVDKSLNTYTYTGLTDDEVYTFTAHAVSTKNEKGPSDSISIWLPVNQTEVKCISNAEELVDLSSNPDIYSKFYIIQTEDIDLSAYSTGTGWVPIGSSTTPFSGRYDGNDHNISNLKIDSTTATSVGFFGSVDGGIIGRVRLIDVDIKGGNEVGGLAGVVSNNSIVVQCFVSGSVLGLSSANAGGIAGTLSGNSSASIYTIISECNTSLTINGRTAGGIVGYAEDSYLELCSSSGVINGLQYAGGLIGILSNSRVSECFSEAVVSAIDFGGGFLGQGNYIELNNCYARGGVDNGGYGIAGGFTGSSTNGNITNCYSSGTISNADISGGFLGQNTGLVNYCYYDSETSGMTDTGKGEPLTTSQMNSITTFSNWDTTNIWVINSTINDGYPYLAENAP